MGGRASRRSLLRTGGLLGAGVVGAALIGCGDDDGDSTPGTATPGGNGTSTPAPGETPSTGEPRSGGRVGGFYGSAIASFNPIENIGEGQYLSGPHVYDRLLAPRLDDRIYVLEAAEEVEVVDDVTVRFTLKPGLVYQDLPPVNGAPLVAEDIVRVQEYARDPETFANAIFQRGSMESVEATDDRTVVFHLQQPNAYLFSGQGLGHPDTMAIIPPQVMENLDETPSVGSGPYQLKEHQLGTRYLYERNPTYWGAADGLPYIDEREMLVLIDSAAQEAAFRGQQVHELFEPTVESSQSIIRDLGDRLTVTEYLAISPFTWDMNARRTRSGWADEELFDDIRIREAFYRLTNQQQITDLVDAGMAENCPGALPVSLERYLVDWADTEQYHRHDPDEARSLLDAAGFDFDHVYRLTTLPAARNDTGLQVLQQQLSNVGIETSAHSVPFSEWLGPVIESGNYDFSIASHPAYDTPLQTLRHNHSDPQQRNNSANLGDPTIDAMIEESERLIDFDEQSQLVKDIQIALLQNYAHRAHINSYIVQNVRWAYLRDWEVSAARHQHIKYQTQAWLDD